MTVKFLFRPRLILSVLFLSISQAVFVQAQTAGQHPWPIKEFFIDPDITLQANIKNTLEADFERAASWYETMQFKSPALNRCVASAPKKQKSACNRMEPVTSSCSAGDQYFIFGQENGMNHNGYAIIADEPSWDTNKPKPNGCLDKSEWDARDKAKGNCGKAWTAPGGYNNLDAIYFNEGDFSKQGMMRQANLPAHELFHAVALAYPGYRGWFAGPGQKAGWLVEGLPDAMAWEWIRKGKAKSSISEEQILELSDPRDTQKGFRFYDYPLHMPLGFGQNKPPCGSVRTHLRKQEYRTWSFWRFLGRQKANYELIREILEQTMGWDNLGLFVVDEGLRKATKKRCDGRPSKIDKQYLPSLPSKTLKTEGINCDTARKYGGLYFFYPRFIADWTETVRKYKDGLRLTFSGKQLIQQSKNPSPGCFPKKIGGGAFILQINAVAANCVQVKPVKRGKALKVSATVTNQTDLENLHLSFNGCVVRPIQRNSPSKHQFLKIWEYPQPGTAGLFGCKAPPKDTWLLVFSNVNHVADKSKAVIPSIEIKVNVGGTGKATGGR